MTYESMTLGDHWPWRPLRAFFNGKLAISRNGWEIRLRLRFITNRK